MVLLIALVCVGLASVVLLALLRLAVAWDDVAQNEEKHLQANWLVESALERTTLRNTGTPINKTLIEKLASSGRWTDMVEDAQTGEFVTVPEEPPEDQSPTQAKTEEEKAAQLAVGGFGSYHPTVSNFLFGDGAVRALSVTINTDVYQQLGHRNDGKLLEAPF